MSEREFPTATRWRMASIASNDALILPHPANPRRMGFSGDDRSYACVRVVNEFAGPGRDATDADLCRSVRSVRYARRRGSTLPCGDWVLLTSTLVGFDHLEAIVGAPHGSCITINAVEITQDEHIHLGPQEA